MASRPVRKPSHRHLRKLPFGLPSRFWALSEWAQLPLRAFLGFTFLFAGLQKIANPDFFSATAPASIHQQIAGAVHKSPIGGLLHGMLGASSLIGWIIALGEVAVGVGTLLGLWTRVAAVGGAVLSLSLFLAVSWNSKPWYTGSDIVFLFAWSALIIAGGGARLSIDGLLHRASAREADIPDPELVAVPFSQIQSLCGNYQHGKCRAQSGRACDPNGCPVIEGPRPSLYARGVADDIDRRTFVRGSAAAGVIAAASALGAVVAGGAGRLLHGSNGTRFTNNGGSTTTTAPGATTTTTPGATTTTTAPSITPGTKVALASDVAVGSSLAFTVPSNGDPGIIIRTSSSTFLCYDATCPHAGCPVGYSPSANLLVCPCHGSQFQVATGDVLAGPAATGLQPLTITESSDGGLYVA